MAKHLEIDEWEDWNIDEDSKTRIKKAAPKWDVPVNPRKSSNISELDFLKRLCNTESHFEHCCTYETVEEYRCHCGTLTKQYRCKQCNTVLCGKNCSLLRSTELLVGKAGGEEAEEVGASDSSFGAGEAGPSDIEKNVSPSHRLGAPEKITAEKMVNTEGLKKDALAPVIETESKLLQENMNPMRDLVSQASAPKGIEERRFRPFGRGFRLQRELSRNKVNSSLGKQSADFDVIGVPDQKNVDASLTPPPSVIRNDTQVQLMIPYEDIFARFPRRDLSNYVGKEMKITSVDGTNRMYLIPNDEFETQVENILDEINDVCKDAEPLNPIPSVGKLACVYQFGKSVHVLMSRCVILEKFLHETKVHLLDFGGEHVICNSNLKPFDDVLEKISLAGYEVLIKGIPSELPKLTNWKLKETVSILVKSQTYRLKSAKKVNGYVYEVELVTSSGKDLPTYITEFADWKWEKLVATKAKVSDDDACHDGALPLRAFGYRISDFPPGPVVMQCCAVNPEKNIIQFGNIQLKSFIRDYTILHDQLAAYAQNVETSPYCPAREAFFIVKRGDVENSQWQRATRATIDDIFCVDSNEKLLFKDLRHTIRKVPEEFFHLPIGSITCKIKSTTIKNLEEALRSRLKIGKYYDVELLSLDSVSSIYEISDSCLHATSSVCLG